jgi:hypothetical protein
MNSNRTLRSSLHAANARPRNSGPLSSTMASRQPAFAGDPIQHARTRRPPNEVSISMVGELKAQIL